MIERQPGDLVIFQHIPKTAGSSLHSVFHLKCRRRAMHNVFAGDYTHPDVEALKLLPDSKKREIQILKGHMPFGLHRLFPQRCVYVTVLREPIRRVISQYFYIRRRPGNQHHRAVVGGKMSVGEFVSSGIAPGINNGQVRWLAGEIHSHGFGKVGSEQLEVAKANIEDHFGLVGTTEHFDETLLLLQRLMGWAGNPFYRRQNVYRRKTPETVTDEDVAVVAEHNRLDIELYDAASTRLLEDISAADISSRVETFRKMNRWYGRVRWPQDWAIQWLRGFR